MKNKIELAKIAIEKLNNHYKESIFVLKHGSTQDYSTIINHTYDYIGNQISIDFYDSEIVCRGYEATINTNSISDLIDEVDQIFKNY